MYLNSFYHTSDWTLVYPPNRHSGPKPRPSKTGKRKNGAGGNGHHQQALDKKKQKKDLSTTTLPQAEEGIQVPDGPDGAEQEEAFGDDGQAGRMEVDES